MAEESTLEGVIERLRAEGQLTRNSGTNSIKSLIETNTNSFGLMSNRMGELIDFFKGNALQDEENRRELLKALKGGKEKEEKEKIEKKPEKLDFFGLGLKGLAIAVAGLVSGFVVGLGAFFVSLLKPIKGFITESKIFKSFKATTIKFGNAIKGFGNTIKGFGNAIKRLGNTIKGFVKNTKSFKLLGRIFSPVGKLFKALPKIFKPIRQIFSAIGKGSKALKGAVGSSLGKKIKPVLDTLKSAVKRFKTFFNVGKTIGMKFLPFLGKLFLPLTIIISLFDFVKGAMEGFNKYKEKGFLEGIIGGLLGGISGLFTGLIGMPLDLLKSAISWIAEKLGFENFSEMLDSFSFSELIGGLFTKVTDIIVGFIGNIKDSIAEIGFADTIKNIGLSLLKIFKKIASFPMAVGAGAAAALAAALPGGQTPMEAFKEGFAEVFNAGDAKIDSFKVPTSGGAGSETGEESLEVKEDDKKTKGFFSRLFSSDKEEAADESFEVASKKADESFEVAARNTTGTEMELGMSNIADAKSQGTPVIVSGGSSPQSTVVNNTTTTYNGSDHVDESYILTRPLTTMAYGF